MTRRSLAKLCFAAFAAFVAPGSAFAQDSAFVSVHDGAFRLGDQPFC